MAVALKVDVEVADRSTSKNAGAARGISGRWQRVLRRVGPWRRRIAAAICVVVPGLAAGPGQAMGLGAASLNSGLGEPLRLSFPVSAKADEDVGCVQVRSRGDELPAVLNTRVSVVRNGFQTRIEIRSAQPIYEPAIGLVVSVGCTSPIAREYVVFLDPPAIAPVAAEPAETSSANPPLPRRTVRAPAVPREPRAVPRRPAERGAAAPLRSGTPSAAARPPRNRSSLPSKMPATPQPEGSTSTTTSVPAAPPPAARERDRLTVAPTEAPRGAPTTDGASVPPGASAPGSATPATSTPPSTAAPAQPLPAAPAASAPTATASSPDPDAVARELALRQQQAELQRQIQVLGDQIAALRVQTTQLVARNQVLEQSGFPAWLVWLLIALALVATLIAAWLAWRYTQLRRTLDGAPWWGGHSIQAPVEREAASSIGAASGLAPLDGGTRLPPRTPTQTDARSPATTSSTTSTNANPERSRPVARDSRYPAAIDTDFTVSDIEAAMATVRTVSPPRGAPRPPKPEDTDLGALGGPTLPSPFAEPPAPPPRSGKVIERDGDDIGKFVDLDIPPLPTPPVRPAASTASTASPSANLKSNAIAEETIEPLDFKLDMPRAYDPLATDSHKTTIVDRADPPAESPPPGPVKGQLLDFEFSTTSVLPAHEADLDIFATDTGARHGATALDDLFAPSAEPGIDTILDLDDRHGTPLSTTEIDRLTTTAVEGPLGDAAPVSARARLSRFADLMNQVGEAAESDPLRAIALLRQYVLRDEDIPTILWLKLFALYKVVDKKPVYEALAEHFARRYGRPMVGWFQTLADRAPQTPLASMSRIDREIEALWGKEEGLQRIRSLLCDRNQEDAIVFNLVLQQDLLDAAKVFPLSDESSLGLAGPDAA